MLAHVLSSLVTAALSLAPLPPAPPRACLVHESCAHEPRVCLVHEGCGDATNDPPICLLSPDCAGVRARGSSR